MILGKEAARAFLILLIPPGARRSEIQPANVSLNYFGNARFLLAVYSTMGIDLSWLGSWRED